MKFLLDLSSLTRSIRISQRPIQDMNHSTRYLFGMHNVDWATVFLQMFSRKLDKLQLENNNYPKYISTESARALIKVILIELIR